VETAASVWRWHCAKIFAGAKRKNAAATRRRHAMFQKNEAQIHIMVSLAEMCRFQGLTFAAISPQKC
jgi:hypothetical protein